MRGNTRKPGWKGPTIREIARLAGVGEATVDRVLNNRLNVREKTRLRVAAALDKLSRDRTGQHDALDITLFSESGATFNAALAAAALDVNRSVPGVRVTGHYETTSGLDPAIFARQLESIGLESDGVVVVARDHPAINRAIRKLRSTGIPVICLTTDLPSSRRSAYIGNDQVAAGGVAGLLIGRALPREPASILIVSSVPYRCQQDRENGCRRVLRTDFPHLKLEERVISDEVPESTCESLLQHFTMHGMPAAIYNVAGANRGVARALEQVGATGRTIFVGHELTSISRTLLETGAIDYVISHDFCGELTAAARWIRENIEGVRVEPSFSQILIHTRHNCT